MTTSRPSARRRTPTAKIVITGPSAAGTSTLIRTISEITVLSTERAVSGAGNDSDARSTVAMDLGRITLSSDLVLSLYGTPAQDRFDVMWDVLGEGMVGYVLLLDGCAAEPATDGAPVRAAFAARSPAPFVVAVNRVTEVDTDSGGALRRELGLESDVPVLAVDVADRESVKVVLLALLHHVLARLDRAPAEL